MWIDLSVFLFVSPFVVVTFVIRVKRLPGSFLGGMDEIQRVMMLETSRRSPLGHISFQTAQSAGTFFKWKQPVSTLLIMLMSRSCWVFFHEKFAEKLFFAENWPKSHRRDLSGHSTLMNTGFIFFFFGAGNTKRHAALCDDIAAARGTLQPEGGMSDIDSLSIHLASL